MPSRIESSSAVSSCSAIALERFLLDSKETIHASITVSGKDLSKINREATEAGKYPGLVLQIAKVPATVAREWVCIPIEVFSAMVDNGQDENLT